MDIGSFAIFIVKYDEEGSGHSVKLFCHRITAKEQKTNPNTNCAAFIQLITITPMITKHFDCFF